MELKGKLVRWNEERGFGFIKSDSFNKEIFIHISALNRMSRKPIINDTIRFELMTGKDEKKKAVNACIEGVPTKRNKNTSQKISKLMSYVLFVVMIIFSCSLGYFTLWPFISVKYNELFVGEDFTGFSCQGKQYCSQMTSCREARFYLKHCPNVKIDGDHDGIPCESLCGY